MAQNTSCVQVLSCTDSPLSMTGSIIGILTLAYTIIITLFYFGHQFARSESDLHDYIHSFQGDAESLSAAVERLFQYHDKIPEPLAGTVMKAVHEAKAFCEEFSHELKSFEFNFRQVSHVYKSYFIIKRKKLREKIAESKQMRNKVDGLYNTVIQRFSTGQNTFMLLSPYSQ